MSRRESPWRRIPEPRLLSRALAVLCGAVAVAVLVTACGGGASGARERDYVEVTGLISSLEESQGRIRSLTVASGADSFELRIADDVDYGFDLQHLKEHRAGALPVRCTVEMRDGDLYALSIADA